MLKPINLKTELMNNPIGITIKQPKLSWSLISDSNKKYQKQSAFQIIAAESEENLRKEIYIWNSGKVFSDNICHIPYEPDLQSRSRIYWCVKVWDQDGQESDYSDIGYFETGLFGKEDWSAKWINPELETNPEKRYPASYVRKDFKVEGKLKEAKLYATACGLYECYINGKRVGNQVLTPGTTQYNKRLQVQTYDVKDYIFDGDNAVGVVLGDGWFRGMNGMNRKRNIYGDNIALLLQLELVYENGVRKTVISDASWKASQGGFIRFNDVQQGETYDANFYLGKWSESYYDDSSWHGVLEYRWDNSTLIGSNSVPITEHEQFKPKILSTPNGETVLDFGQNMSGYVSFDIKGSKEIKGTCITLIHGEALDEDGNFTLKHLEPLSEKKPHMKQEVNYIVSEKANQYYKTSMTVFGFRYVLLKNWPYEPFPEDFTAYAVYSDVSETGSFTCSDELINKLVLNTKWSQKSNFVDVPTDCPTRERSGYTGDAQVYVETGTMLMDGLQFFRKWLADLRATQSPNGKIANIAPMPDKKFSFFDGSAGWGDAIVIIPYKLYKQYGDTQVLKENYDSMKAWVDFELGEAQKSHLLRKFSRNRYKKYLWDTGFHWGEWLEPGQTNAYISNIVFFGCPETATAYMHYSCKLLAEVSEILGYKENAKKYAKAAENSKKAYQYEFLRNNINSERQCLYVRPLMFGLLEKEDEQKVADNLNSLVIKNNYHINTGFLSTPFICEVLERYGYLDTAYRLLEQKTIPSWLYAVTKGATTIWECWDGVNEEGKPKNSMNHYAYGAIIGWLFRSVAGIKEPVDGYKKFTVAPKPGGSLTRAEATYNSINGQIKSKWEYIDNKLHVQVDVPVNTEATIILPVDLIEKVVEFPNDCNLEIQNNSVYCKVGSGYYSFLIDKRNY
ncbi:alpha-L-rhamnosidase [Clostridium fungisolvens]|uniref:alpha-L-rhamnosidase n=1 Tax=Clostridium fungisolvens TaxID=1604897 RepID=A0A6V8SBU3_9CLOT|nr:alpha-L-rhamnosidase [Clostridium fungisolvens]GFP74687.1 Alpha-L-rhamnosidase [Clostridium fungisolvens]